MMGKVTMFHPQSQVTQDASAAAHETHWRDQGWQIVDTQAPTPVPDPELEAARSEAESLGISVHPNAKADTIRKRIAEHDQGTAE